MYWGYLIRTVYGEVTYIHLAVKSEFNRVDFVNYKSLPGFILRLLLTPYK